MNKFLPVTGGHPLKLDDLMMMQNAYLSGFLGLVSALSPTGNSVLKGIQVTIAGGAVTYTNGYVAILGEIYQVIGSSFAQSVNPSDILYFNPVETPIPPDPTQYQDTSIKNVHLSRLAVLKYKTVSDTLGAEYLKCLRPDAGDIRDWAPPAGTGIFDFFDATGLGIGIKEGWALCNGLNSTPDLRGFYTAQATNVPASGAGSLNGALSGNTNSFGDQTGIGKIALTQSNIPLYNLPVTDNGHTHIVTAQNTDAAGVGVLTGGAPNAANDGQAITSLGFTGISVGSGGGNIPFDNRPPTFYLYKIMKVN